MNKNKPKISFKNGLIYVNGKLPKSKRNDDAQQRAIAYTIGDRLLPKNNKKGSK